MGRGTGTRRGSGVIRTPAGSTADVEQPRQNLNAASTFLGRRITAENLQSLSGAVRNESVRMGISRRYMTLSSRSGYVTFSRGANGSINIFSTNLPLRRLARTLGGLQDVGFRSVTMSTRRSSTNNSYYNSALLGFNRRLSGAERRGGTFTRIPASVRNARTINDLMRTAEGRAWFKRYGRGGRVEFDLRGGSQSVRILNGFLRRGRNET